MSGSAGKQSPSKNVVTYDLDPTKPSTDPAEAQMTQLYEEVAEMKKLMAHLKKGNAISQIDDGDGEK